VLPPRPSRPSCTAHSAQMQGPTEGWVTKWVSIPGKWMCKRNDLLFPKTLQNALQLVRAQMIQRNNIRALVNSHARFLGFLAALVFELRASYLLVKHLTHTSSHASSPFCFSYFSERVSHFCPGLVSDSYPSMQQG
jgi:hypothetical protein